MYIQEKAQASARTTPTHTRPCARECTRL